MGKNKHGKWKEFLSAKLTYCLQGYSWLFPGKERKKRWVLLKHNRLESTAIYLFCSQKLKTNPQEHVGSLFLKGGKKSRIWALPSLSKGPLKESKGSLAISRNDNYHNWALIWVLLITLWPQTSFFGTVRSVYKFLFPKLYKTLIPAYLCWDKWVVFIISFSFPTTVFFKYKCVLNVDVLKIDEMWGWH